MIEWLVLAALAGLAAGAAVSLSGDVRRSVATWLREHHLAHTALMDAWIVLDRAAGGIRARLRLTTRQYGSQEVVLEHTYRWDQIDDPEIRRLLGGRGRAETRILDQLT